MVKKAILGVVIVAAIIAIAWMYFKLTNNNGTYTSSVEGIPASYAFVVNSDPNHYNAEEMNLLITLAQAENKLGDISFNPLQEWPALIEELINLQSYQPSWKTLLDNSDIVFASGPQCMSENWLMSIGLKAETSPGSVEEMMFAWKPEKGFARREFKGGQILSNDKLHYCIQHNCLLVSSSVSIIEDAIIQHQKNNNLYGIAGFENSYRVMSADNFLNFFSKSGESNWLQLNPITRNGMWILGGYFLVNDSLENTLQLSGVGIAPRIQDHIPATTVLLDAYAYENFETGWAAAESFSKHNNPRESLFWSQAWKDYGDSCQCDLNEKMLSWRNGEWGTVILTNPDSTTSKVLYMGVKDSTNVLALMQPLLGNALASGAHELKYPALFDRNKPQSVLIETNYIHQKGNYVFVASNPTDLAMAANNGSPLSMSPAFSNTYKSIGKKTSRYLYQTGLLSTPFAPGILNVLKGLDGYFITSEIYKQNKMLIEIALPIESGKTSEPEDPSSEAVESTDQTTNLSDALRGPWNVINHNTKGKEQIYQNKNKELCLVGEDGKTLWTYPLDAEIVGVVSQIDALKNGKLQYAFAAGKYLHAIDRTGKSLQSFPVLLGSQASSSLFVFDYDNTRSYRMIVGSEDGALHNHNAQGKMNEGWKYSGNAPIAWVKHHKVSGEDVLIAVTHAGSVKVLKRNGEVKMETTSTLADWNGKDFEIQALGALKDLKITYQTASGESKTTGL